MPSWSRHKLPYYFVDTEPMCEHANSVCVLQPVRIAAIHDPPVSPRLSFRSSCIPGLFTVGATGWPLLAVSRLLERPALHGSSRTKARETPFTQWSEQARCPPGPGVHTGAQAQAAPSQDDAVDRPVQGLGLPCCSPPRPFRPPRRPPAAAGGSGSRVTRNSPHWPPRQPAAAAGQSSRRRRRLAWSAAALQRGCRRRAARAPALVAAITAEQCGGLLGRRPAARRPRQTSDTATQCQRPARAWRRATVAAGGATGMDPAARGPFSRRP
jgi:hypothetical protein